MQSFAVKKCQQSMLEIDTPRKLPFLDHVLNDILLPLLLALKRIVDLGSLFTL